MKKWSKSKWLPLVLLVYVTATAVYLLPRNTEISTGEKYWTIGFAYLIVFALWLVLRKKEQLRRRYEQDDQRRQILQNRDKSDTGQSDPKNKK